MLSSGPHAGPAAPLGFLNCNKPPGMTSRDLVNIVQRQLREEWSSGSRPASSPGKLKVGHAGTLDPLATGVLVIAVGSASRLVPYVQQQAKHYRAVFRLGESSPSGDLEGETVRHPDLPRPPETSIRAAATRLVGTIEQTPPAYSAIWVDGQRAYRRVRAGEAVAMPSRQVEVYRLDVIRYQYPEVELDIACGSGTYIRSLGIDLAAAAGSTAVMTELVRLGVGPFSLSEALDVEQLRRSALTPQLLPPTLGVAQLPCLNISAAESVRLGHGLPIDAGQHSAAGVEAAAMREGGPLRAIVRYRDGQWYPHRVFPD